VFTSLRITGGYGHDLEAHLARLDESAWQLFGKHLPPSLPAQLAACLAERPSGRLRIMARPAGGPLQVTVESIPAGPAPAAVALRSVIIPGGLGAHKWRDRRLLAALTETASPGPGEHLLIEDSSSDVLETDRANLFAVIGGVLYTPPADGRLLPGITRAAILRLAEQDGITTKEEPLSQQRLLDAGEVFVTNSVQGILPAHSLAGTPAAWSAGPITTRLQALLARRPAASSPTRPVSRRRPEQALCGRAGRTSPAIVLVDNYDSFTYNLAHLLLMSGCQVEVVRNDEVTAFDIAAFRPGGIVISPGPGTPADAGISINTVRTCAATTPLLGICLGHQAIAAAYGATITTALQPVHGQATVITHDGYGVLAGLPQPFHGARYHSLTVDEYSLPPELAITARGPGGIPMGLRHTHHPAEGLQFHPESILTVHGSDIIRNFVRTVRSQ
jgi:para-aminobenzoate synthetase/4-amino-4-deoxychorismate lyase